MTKRWLTLGALALAVATGALSASAASATDPLTLDSGYVTDQADVLSPAEEEQVESRLQELTDNSSADLFVVLVDDFTDPWTRAETVVLLPFAVLGGASGLSRAKRANKERAFKMAMEGCLAERGYQVAGWSKAVKTPMIVAETKADQ